MIESKQSLGLALKDKLHVSYLLFTSRGRIARFPYWTASVLIWSAFYSLNHVLDFFIGPVAMWILSPILFWALIATAMKRLHDTNFSGWWLTAVFIPLAGPFFLIYLLAFRKGTVSYNRFGSDPRSAADYFKNGAGEQIPHLKTGDRIINDVTRLNPIIVARIETPSTIEELQRIITSTDGPISIGGGRFSMGGQTASPKSLHLDLRRLNQVIAFSAESRLIHVQAGTRWCDIQCYVDRHNLSIKIMQTYANFTVGGALSVNCHGRYIGLGPLILSVRSVTLIMASGELVRASTTENAELFFASVGCYNAIAVIASVELELEANVAVERVHETMDRSEYKDFFFSQVRENKNVVFHNGDLYPPSFKMIRGVSWIKSDKKPTVKTRLMPLAASYPLERYFMGAFSKGKFGKWRRQYVYDPILFSKKIVHWRNYEAGYDVAELEPESRKFHTYVLQEYFAPVARFNEFAEQMAEIFTRHDVNVINVSIRHALPDSGSMLAWAREEVFAFVVWYKQRTDDVEKNKVGVWTRELVDAAIAVGGAYYLPYQVHATEHQFHLAYPHAKKLMALKSKLDPTYKFRNVIWDTYYHPNEN